jgi:type I restriction enzyme S subunit
MPQAAIKNDWQESTLGMIADINPRESLKKATIAKSVAMEQLLPFTRKIAGYEVKAFSGGTKFRNGDTLLARITPCLENGKTAYVDILETDETGFGSTEFIVIREKPNFSDKKFLYYFVTSPTFREAAIRSMTGTSGRQRVQTDLIANKVFRLPSALEQKAVGAVLSVFDDKIELLQDQNRVLEAIIQKLFCEWFIEFNFLDEKEKPYKKNDGKMVSTPSGELPLAWRMGALEELVSHVKNGVTPSKRPDVIFNHYSLPAFDAGQIPLREKGEEILSNKYSVKENSFLVSKLNPHTPRIWMVFQQEENAICSTEFQVMTPKVFENFSFVFSILNSSIFTRELASKIQGTSKSHQRVRPEDILKINTVIPSREVLEKYQSLILPMLKKIDTNKTQIRSLSALRDFLLPRMMHGEVRVQTN